MDTKEPRSNKRKNILGEGAYGYVRKTGKSAVKVFKKDYSVIQEYAAGNYLKDCPYIVEVTGVDLVNHEMTMKLYDCTLSEWIYNNPPLSDKWWCFGEILKALVYLNDLGLVHGDVKPSNILLKLNYGKGKSNPTVRKLVLGDIGFVAVEKFSKTRRTTSIYREGDIKSDFRHDIFSCGVLALEMFGNIRIREQFDSENLIKLTHKRVSDTKIKAAIIRMVDSERRKRPTARALMEDLYGESLPIQLYEGDLTYPNILDKKDISKIGNIFKSYGSGTPKTKIYRTKIGFEATKCYLSRNRVDPSLHIVYVSAMLIISSSIFGNNVFGIKSAIELSNDSEKVIYSAMKNLLDDKHVLHYIFYTNKSCKP